MAEVNSLFKFHKLNEEGIQKAVHIAEVFNALYNEILAIVPQASRERSIAFTKLEEAAFFAKKAMAQSELNQV